MDRPAPRAETPGSLAAAVLFPFLLTRALLLAVAWFGRQFAPSWTYFDPAGATRGWSRVPALALDVWGRYDTAWYLDIAARGYVPPADLAHSQSNLAFFPLYPWLVRGLHALFPAAWQGDEARYLAALALSNALALCALAPSTRSSAPRTATSARGARVLYPSSPLFPAPTSRLPSAAACAPRGLQGRVGASRARAPSSWA
jgi:hypothetical protein